MVRTNRMKKIPPAAADEEIMMISLSSGISVCGGRMHTRMIENNYGQL